MNTKRKRDNRYLIPKMPRYIHKGITYKMSVLVRALGYNKYGLKIAIDKGYPVDGAVITRVK